MQDISEIVADMRRVEATDKPKITEEAFVKHLLPLLVNRDRVPDLDVTVWLDIAGNPHRPIDVAKRDGEVLFTIPPLIARTPTLAPSKEYRGAEGLNEIMAVYAAKQTTEHPAAADVFLEHALRNQVLSADQQQLLDFLRQWVFIYRRYDIPLEPLLGPYAATAAATQDAAAPAPKADIDDFEDL